MTLEDGDLLKLALQPDREYGLKVFKLWRRMMNQRVAWVLFSLLSTMIGCGAPGGGGGSNPPEITSVYGNSPLDGSIFLDGLVVIGSNFTSDCAVTLADNTGTRDLITEFADATQLESELPSDLEPGLYSLTVSNAHGQDSQDVTILRGETGPQGPEGPQGEDGPQGPPGDQGDPGMIFDTFTVGGTITGLIGTVVLQNLGADDLSISVDGPFTFSIPLINGSYYHVTVQTQPPGQSCLVVQDYYSESGDNDPSTGWIEGSNVSDLTVLCQAGYSVGGTVSGLVGTVTLRGSGDPDYDGDHSDIRMDIAISSNGAYDFPMLFPDGSYSVSVIEDPMDQICEVANHSGTISGANVTDVDVTCAPIPTPTPTPTPCADPESPSICGPEPHEGSGGCPGGSMLLTPLSPSGTADGCLRENPGGTHDTYAIWVLDTTGFASGKLVLDIQIGDGLGYASMDLYDECVDWITNPYESLASAWDRAPGSQIHFEYDFSSGRNFQFGITGNWSSEPYETNTWSMTVEVQDGMAACP